MHIEWEPIWLQMPEKNKVQITSVGGTVLVMQADTERDAEKWFHTLEHAAATAKERDFTSYLCTLCGSSILLYL